MLDLLSISKSTKLKRYEFMAVWLYLVPDYF